MIKNDEEETITLIGLCTVLGVSLFTLFGIIPFIIKFFDERFFTRSMNESFAIISYISLILLLPITIKFVIKKSKNKLLNAKKKTKEIISLLYVSWKEKYNILIPFIKNKVSIFLTSKNTKKIFKKLRKYQQLIIGIIIGILIFSICSSQKNTSMPNNTVTSTTSPNNTVVEDKPKIEKNVWCGYYSHHGRSGNDFYIYKEDIAKGGTEKQCGAFLNNDSESVWLYFTQPEIAKQWQQYDRQIIIIKGPLRPNRFGRGYEIENPRFLDYNS